MFHQGHLINSLKDGSTHEDLEEIHWNILSASYLANTKLLKKNEVVLYKDPLNVRSLKSNYLNDYLVITKHGNPEVIRIYIEMARKEAGVVMRYEDLPEKLTDLHKSSRKRKQVVSDAQKIIQKPPKKKFVQ